LTHPSRRNALLVRLAAAVVPLALVVGTSPATSTAAAAPRVTPRVTTTNPLAGRPWGVYKGDAEMAWPPYAAATGHRKKLLGKIALRPKAKWFGAWIPDRDIAAKVHDYIDNATGGDPDVLVQMTVFRMVPWEAEVDDRLPTRREQRSYKAWIDSFAAAVGDRTHAAIILQPDGPLALKAPNGSTLPSRMIAYAARRFAGLAHTSTYIDAGASDWPAGQPELAAKELELFQRLSG